MFKNVIVIPKNLKNIVNLYNASNLVYYLSYEYGVANVTIYKWIKELSPIKVLEKDDTLLKHTKS